MAKKKDVFKTGVVTVQFKKSLHYVDSKGKVIESLKDQPQFVKGDRVKFHFKKAGELVKNGYVDLLDEQVRVVNTKEAAKQ